MDGPTFRWCDGDDLSWRWGPKTDEPTPWRSTHRQVGSGSLTMMMTIRRSRLSHISIWGGRESIWGDESMKRTIILVVVVGALLAAANAFINAGNSPTTEDQVRMQLV